MKRQRVCMAALVPALLLLGGCGLHPLYAGGGNGAVARGLAAIDVPPIEGKAGWLMRNALNDRLHAGQGAGGSARYPLHIRVDDKPEGAGLFFPDTIGPQPRPPRAR